LPAELTRSPATPATTALLAAGLQWRSHSYKHSHSTSSYGLEAASALKVDAGRVCKTLIAQVEGGGLVVGIVPVSMLLDLKALAQVAGGKHAELATPSIAERSSGYVIGGISPIGQRKALPTFLDESAILFETIFVSGGRRGFDIELSPSDLLMITAGQYAAIAR
jgi:Cys-tRNA(Pro)/Cys-tRNA(Cys) deacylase